VALDAAGNEQLQDLNEMAATSDVARASLYRAPINLWVEDGVTRAYLSATWSSPDVAFLIAGGNEGVRAIANDAQQSNFNNVFGLIDRDFRPNNKPDWTNPNKTFRTFVLPVHEIENYLLDPRALTAIRLNTLKKSEAEIDAFMKSAARRLSWWVACRKVVAELRDRFRSDFIPDPKCPPVTSEAEARKHICQSTWLRKLATTTKRTTVRDIHRLLADAHS
jgi:hypothetical protein